MPTTPGAQETHPDDIFYAAAQANPQYALSMSYVVGQDAPVVMTSGPTVKGGSLAVANDARWHIGSISKSFTATLVMRLVDRGQLNLDAPIGQYLGRYTDDMHSDWQALTLRQLLSHTAGLPANASRRIMAATLEDQPYEGRRTVLSAMWRDGLDHDTGDFLYSNIGYVLAGVVVEEVLHTSWEAAILAEIGTPLGLSSLGFGAPLQPDDARGHRSVLGFKRPVNPQDQGADNPRWMGPAGTIHLSMADLARWGQIHMAACAGRLPDYLSQSGCQTMRTPVSADYGLGWVNQQTDPVGQVVWHNGSNTMWYAVLIVAPEHELTVALATNVDASARIEKLAQNMITALVQGGR